MKKLFFTGALLLSLLLSHAENKKVEPEEYAGADKVLDPNELKEYRIDRQQLRRGKPETDRNVAMWLHQLKTNLQKDPPYTPAEVLKGEGRRPKEEQFATPGILRKSYDNPPFGKSWGPFRLRKSFEDWSEDLADVSGASISHQNDREEDKDTWASEGALIYPFVIAKEKNRDAGKVYSSYEWQLLPSVVWKLSDVSNSTNDVEDLQLQLPIGFWGSHNTAPLGAEEWYDEVTLNPFFQTDFHGHGRVIGATLNYELQFEIGALDFNQWHVVPNTRAFYLLRVQPKLEYSNVLRGSRFIDRPEDDEWFRGGAKLEAGLRPFGRNARWELRAIYTFLSNFEGGHDAYSDLFEAKTAYWFNENAGLTFSYQKGETPVSDKDINLLKVGLELKL